MGVEERCPPSQKLRVGLGLTRVQGSGFGVQGARFRVQGSGSRVQGVGSYRRGLQPQGLQLVQLDWVPFEEYLRWGLEVGD